MGDDAARLRRPWLRRLSIFTQCRLDCSLNQ
jgi:hypothetical protein